MNISHKSVLTIALPFVLTVFGANVSAEESAAPAAQSSAAAASASPASEVVARIEKGLIEVAKNDFSAAQVQLKAARASSESIMDSSAEAKKAHAILIQGQIAAKAGNVSKATDELNKAIEIYKTL
jgi:hypothetical protein